MSESPKRSASPTRLKETELLRRFWHWMAPWKRTIAASMFLVPLVAACGVAQPRILGLAIDEFMLKKDLDGLAMAALAFGGVITLEYILGSAQVYLLVAAGTRATGVMRRDVYRHVMGQGQWFFDRRATGSLLSRTTTDIESLGESFTMGVVGILGDAAKLIGIVGYMFSLDWELTLGAFSVLPVIVLILSFFRTRLRDVSVTIRVLSARLNGFMAEHVAGAEVVQLLNREERTSDEFREINDEALKTYHLSNFYDSVLYALMDGVSSMCIGAVVWFGGASVFAGTLSPGLLVAFIEYVQRALVPIKEFSGKYATMQRSFAALDRIYELLDTHEELTEGTKTIESPRGAIRFE
ncbi:MAG: ATP-binding cassette subfamily B multidrug efflux pump, partial [Myxococcota bacterium]